MIGRANQGTREIRRWPLGALAAALACSPALSGSGRGSHPKGSDSGTESIFEEAQPDEAPPPALPQDPLRAVQCGTSPRVAFAARPEYRGSHLAWTSPPGVRLETSLSVVTWLDSRLRSESTSLRTLDCAPGEFCVLLPGVSGERFLPALTPPTPGDAASFSQLRPELRSELEIAASHRRERAALHLALSLSNSPVLAIGVNYLDTLRDSDLRASLTSALESGWACVTAPQCSPDSAAPEPHSAGREPPQGGPRSAFPAGTTSQSDTLEAPRVLHLVGTPPNSDLGESLAFLAFAFDGSTPLVPRSALDRIALALEGSHASGVVALPGLWGLGVVVPAEHLSDTLVIVQSAYQTSLSTPEDTLIPQRAGPDLGSCFAYHRATSGSSAEQGPSPLHFYLEGPLGTLESHATIVPVTPSLGAHLYPGPHRP